MNKIGITDGVVIPSDKSGLTYIAGPCAIESRETCHKVAKELVNNAKYLNVDLIFKSSFDKANRTSLDSYRGLGMEKGLDILEDIKDTYGIPVTTDIHESWQAEIVAEVVDLIQIPAFLCRQTDMIKAAVETNLPVNIKKGQFLAPQEAIYVMEKAKSCKGSGGLMMTERGTTFGYHKLVNDFTTIPKLKDAGINVIFDATHSTQSPGYGEGKSGGNRRFAKYLSIAAVAVGVDGIFFEVHPDPDNAKCDGPNMIPLAESYQFMRACEEIEEARGSLVFKDM